MGIQWAFWSAICLVSIIGIAWQGTYKGD